MRVALKMGIGNNCIKLGICSSIEICLPNEQLFIACGHILKIVVSYFLTIQMSPVYQQIKYLSCELVSCVINGVFLCAIFLRGLAHIKKLLENDIYYHVFS